MKDLNRRQQATLMSLAELQHWEAQHCTPLNTVCGRFLYFKIAEQVMSETQGSQSLKDIHVDAHVSERAIRLKLREFERDGLIEAVSSQSDKRARLLTATPKLRALIAAHAQAMDQALGKSLLVIEKNQ